MPKNPRNEGKKRILIVDDHPLVRIGLSELLKTEDDLEIIGQVDSAADALTSIEREKPDLAIVDLSLKGTNGLELIKQIKSRKLDTPVLVSSMHDENTYAERALRAGALGYVNKEEPPDTILEAIRQVLAGKVALSENMSERMLSRFSGHDPADGPDPIQTLSDRELEVFKHIGHGMTTRDIADKLNLSVKTIETYRDTIKKKLGIQTNPELIRAAVLHVVEEEAAVEEA